MTKSAEIKVQINKKDLDEYAKETINDLEKKLKNAEQREKKLRSKLKKQEEEIELANRILKDFKIFIGSYAYELDLVNADGEIII